MDILEIIGLIVIGMLIIVIAILSLVIKMLKNKLKESKKFSNRLVAVHLGDNAYLGSQRKAVNDYPLTFLKLTNYINNAMEFKTIEDVKFCIKQFCNLNLKYQEKEFIILAKENEV